MAQSTTINLPRSHQAVFLPQCVVCNCAEPDSSVRLVAGTIGWWIWLTWFWGWPIVVKAPACHGCAWALYGRKVFSILITLLTVSAAIWLVWPFFGHHVPPAFRKIAMMGLGVASLVPQVIFEIYFAAPFSVTAKTDNVDYEFTSMEYAVEFAFANRDAAWVKINDRSYKS